MTEPLWTGTEWSDKTLERAYKAIEQIAVEELKLDPYPAQLEIITSEQMVDAYTSVGMPIFYHHWSFGKHFTAQWSHYQRGMMGLAYEIVINSDPCIAYLMEENTMTMQALVMAHAAMGHSHFFKNNYLFREWTDASSIIDYLVFAREYIKKCEVREGRAEVESLLDSCHALMSYGINRSKRPAKLSLTKERTRNDTRDAYNQTQVTELSEFYKTLQTVTPDIETKRFPPEPEENILYFCEKYAPDLPEWKREIIRIVRKISQYFYPQGLCLCGETYVSTDNGMQRIKDVVIQDGHIAKIANILSVDNKHEQTSHFFKRRVSSTVRVRTKLGRTIEGTPEHPLQTIQPHMDLAMVRLDELAIGSRLVMKLGYDRAFATEPARFDFTPAIQADTVTCAICERRFGNLSTHIPTHNITIADYKNAHSEEIIAPSVIASRSSAIKIPITMNTGLARLFGYWAAEGSLGEHVWSISNTDITIIDDVLGVLKSEFNIEATVNQRDEPDKQVIWTVSVCNANYREFLAHCGMSSGVRSQTQCVPWVIMQSNKEMIRHFLSALFEGDGCNTSDGYIRYCSTSETLVQQLQLILCHFGIASTIRQTVDAWILSIISDFYNVFLNDIGFQSKRKQVSNGAAATSPFSDVPYLKNYLDRIRDSIDPATSKNKSLRRESLPYTSSTEFSRSKITKQKEQFDYIRTVDAGAHDKIIKIIDPTNYYDEVIAIEWVNESKDVYDFTIPSNHLFMSDCYVSNNTKVMNEGTATYVHYRIMNRLHDKGLMTNGSMLEFLHSHTGVVMQPGFDNPHYSGINPYALGFAMMQDIERICWEPAEEDRKQFDFAGCRDEMTVLKEAWENYRDESFIRQFLSRKVIRDLDLFQLKDNRREPNYLVTAIHNERGYEQIRESLANSYERHQTVPQMEVVKVDPVSRTLMLEYHPHQKRALANVTKMAKHIHNLWGHPVTIYDDKHNSLV